MCTSCGKSTKVTSTHTSRSNGRTITHKAVSGTPSMYGKPKVKMSFGTKSRGR